MSGLPGHGWSWEGATVGLLLAVGLALVAYGVPAGRRPGLHERLEPYLRDTPRPSRLLAGTTSGVAGLGVGRTVGALLTDLAARTDRLLGGQASVRRRLQRAGRAPDVERFRAEQVVCGVVGALVGLALGVLALVARGTGVLPVVVLVVSSTLAGPCCATSC